MPEYRNNLVGEVDCVVNAIRRLELKLQPAIVKKLRLLVEGTLNIIGLAGSVAVEDNPFSFLREARIETSDGIRLKSLSAVSQAMIQQYEKGTAPLADGVLVGAIVAGAYNFRFVMELDFDRETAITPEATALNSNTISNLFLICNWGNDADFATAGLLTTQTLTALRCQVTSVERDTVDETDALLDRLQNVQTVQNAQSAALNQRLALDLPDNAEIDSIAIIARDNTVGGLARSDAMINEVRVEVDNGRTVLRRLNWNEIRSQNKELYNQEALIIGFGLLAFDPDGGLDDMLDLRGRNTPQLVLDVNAPTVPGVATYEVTTRQIITT